MNSLVALFRFLFNTILVTTGVITAIMIVMVVFNTITINSTDSRLLIENSPAGRSLSNLEIRALYADLNPRADEVNTPLSLDPSLVAFTIDTGETAQSVAEKLQTTGLISEAQLFRQLLRYNGIDTRLQIGAYQLRRNMTMKEVASALYRGRSSRLTLIVPAGWRLEQLAQHLSAANIMDGNQFMRLAQQGTAFNHPLLDDRPSGQSYEGYLFPDTYYLLDHATPQDLLAALLNNLASKLPPNYQELAQQQGLTFYEVLTIASIVERETARPEERSLVASVYLNRLNPAYGLPHLQADPTVQYAMGYQANTGQWWKSPVSLTEYQQVDSPYNTYLYADLPPGPIASPSLSAIMAVLQPTQTNYLFFVCRNPNCQGGDHVFATTYEEHLQNVTVYWGE